MSVPGVICIVLMAFAAGAAAVITVVCLLEREI